MKETASQRKKDKVLRTSMYVAVLIGLAGFLIFSILAAITFGNADLSLKDVYSVIAYKLFHIKRLSAYAEGAVHDVVWLIRLPRVLLALAVGMALSVCGVVMQAIVQNPLADPYVLGISSGASLGATLAIMLGIGSFLGGNSVGITAFIGAMITSFAVMAIANMGGKATSAKLILAGMAVSAVCSAFSNFVHDVVWLIRLPRVLLALAVGMALSVCGVVMQAIVQNPLADPYVLGISSGASLGATLAIMLGIGSFLGGNSVGITAFIGAMITSFAVMAIANMGGKATSAKLILAGMAVSAVCSAFSNFVIYITNDKNAATEVMKWSMGSLAGASWTRVGVMLPVTLVCVAVFWTQYRNLNLMLLGDDVSITLGTDLHRLRTFYLIVASVMIGFAVYCAGVIGFVGLVIPHVVRILFGTDHRKLLPLSALLGASFLIWCDVACRVILKNSEMPIGVLVSIIGAPCFIYLLVRKSYGFGGAR